MSLLCGILSKRGFGVATKETSYNGAIIEVTWQLYQRTVVVKVNKSLRTTVRRLRRRRHHTLGHSPEKLAENDCFFICTKVQYTLDLRKPDLRKNLDLRKIGATIDFLVHKLFDLRKIF